AVIGRSVYVKGTDDARHTDVPGRGSVLVVGQHRQHVGVGAGQLVGPDLQDRGDPGSGEAQGPLVEIGAVVEVERGRVGPLGDGPQRAAVAVVAAALFEHVAAGERITVEPGRAGRRAQGRDVRLDRVPVVGRGPGQRGAPGRAAVEGVDRVADTAGADDVDLHGRVGAAVGVERDVGDDRPGASGDPASVELEVVDLVEDRGPVEDPLLGPGG